MLQQVDPLALVGELNELESHSNGSYSAAAAATSTTLEVIPRFELPRCVSGKLPGGLRYVRADLPPTTSAEFKRPGSSGTEGNHDGGGDQALAPPAAAAAQGGSDAVKSFATGAINIRGGARSVVGVGRGGDGEAEGEGSSESQPGGYCVVRVDSLGRTCGLIYCGFEEVEPKNLSRVVGVHLGYLQVSNLSLHK